jgi:hypothetical protein
MSFITDLFSGGASKIVDSVGNTLDKVITTKGEKMQMENELKKAEMEYQVEIVKLSVQEHQMMYGDLASARGREQAVQQSSTSTRLGKNISSYLAIAATVLCFALFYILVFKQESVAPEQKDILIYILGVLSALLTQVYSYFFGSSAGSRDKSNTIATALQHKGN